MSFVFARSRFFRPPDFHIPFAPRKRTQNAPPLLLFLVSWRPITGTISSNSHLVAFEVPHEGSRSRQLGSNGGRQSVQRNSARGPSRRFGGHGDARSDRARAGPRSKGNRRC